MMLARYDNVGCTHGIDGHNLQVVDGEIDGDDLCPFYAQRHRQSCRSGFMTLSPVPLLEKYRYGSFVGGAQIVQGVGYRGIRLTREFMGFGPPEHNTLRPRVNGVVLLRLSARLRSSLFSLSVRVCRVRPGSVPCDCRLPGPFIAQGRAVIGRPYGPTGGPGAGRPLKS
jgi:hypothetical protein